MYAHASRGDSRPMSPSPCRPETCRCHMDAEVQQPSYRLAYVGQIVFPSRCFLRRTHRPAWWSYVRDRGGSVNLVMEGVARRKVQTPGTAEEHNRQETPTINPNDHQPTQLTVQAPGIFERAAWESRDTTPISTAAVHALSTATTCTRNHYPHPTGSSQDPLSQRSPL